MLLCIQRTKCAERVKSRMEGADYTRLLMLTGRDTLVVGGINLSTLTYRGGKGRKGVVLGWEWKVCLRLCSDDPIHQRQRSDDGVFTFIRNRYEPTRTHIHTG